jgi:hypothetical protein
LKNVVGLFDDPACAGQAIEWLSLKNLGKNLTIITSDLIIHTPPSVDVDQLSTEGNRAVKGTSTTTRAEQATWEKGGWGSYIPTKTLEKIGVKGIHEILLSRGVAEEEARFYAEGVKNAGILLVVDVEGGHYAEVQQLFECANGRIIKGEEKVEFIDGC